MHVSFINFYRETLNPHVRYSVSYVNCPDVKNYGNGAQVLARCALGEVNDINMSQLKSYLSVECEVSQGMPDSNFILTCLCYQKHVLMSTVLF